MQMKQVKLTDNWWRKHRDLCDIPVSNNDFRRLVFGVDPDFMYIRIQLRYALFYDLMVEDCR